METKWHLRVRAVIFYEGKFLFWRAKEGGDRCSLLGGHVEEGESLPVALKREILEESGRDSEVGNYLGALENAWERDGVKHWEVMHFFEVTISDLENNPGVISAEDDMEFFWGSPEEFEKINLLPIPLRDLMKSWARGERKTWWGSSM